jgi:protease I
MKKVIFVIAHEGYQPIEYGEPKKILEEAGVRVDTASDEIGAARASDGMSSVKISINLKNVSPEEYDGVFFIGGSGSADFLDNEESYKLARSFVSADKLCGAICYSPRILAHAGVLKGKKVTGWDGDGELGGIFVSAGAEYIKEPVVVDGKIITANGPRSAAEWGRKIVEVLL